MDHSKLCTQTLNGFFPWPPAIVGSNVWQADTTVDTTLWSCTFVALPVDPGEKRAADFGRVKCSAGPKTGEGPDIGSGT